MSIVLQKTLPTELGVFIQFYIFKEISESLNRIPLNDSGTGCCAVLSHAFSRKALKLVLCFFFPCTKLIWEPCYLKTQGSVKAG